MSVRACHAAGTKRVQNNEMTVLLNRLRPLANIAKAAIVAIVAVCLVRVSWAATTAPSLPSQITDETFWRIVTDFSEPDGHFLSDNFASNESAYQQVIPDLNKAVEPGGVYLGVGPEQNFTYLVALRPQVAFIVDIRRQNLLEHLLYKALIELSADRVEFLSRLFSLEPPSGIDHTSTIDALFGAYDKATRNRSLYVHNLDEVREHLVNHHGFSLSSGDLKQLEYVYNTFYIYGPHLRYSFPGAGSLVLQLFPTYSELMTATDRAGVERSYLANEQSFHTLKELQQTNRVIPLVGDFAGPTTIRSVGRYLKEHDATLTAFYTSNVEQYLFQQDDAWRRFYDNVAALPIDATSLVIRSVSTNGSQTSGPSRLATPHLSSVTDLLQAYNEGKIASYSDIIAMSH
jgi:hypothetical protein